MHIFAATLSCRPGKEIRSDTCFNTCFTFDQPPYDEGITKINIEKTKAMKFSGNGHKCKSVFIYNGKPLENVAKYKYLGIEFSSSGLWSSAIANISNRGKKALFLLKGYIC